VAFWLAVNGIGYGRIHGTGGNLHLRQRSILAHH